ncbi:MAG: ThiF family adenylyltransferase [Micrococcales bacterium]|nr:ThiF family adenylyltransferase [Micrococcales bacterium]
MHLKAGLKWMWRSELQAQVGIDSALRVVLDLEHPGEHRIGEALASHSTITQIRGMLKREGADPKRATRIIGELRRAGLLCEPGRPTSRFSIPPGLRERLAPGAETRALLIEGDGWEEQVRLAKAAVLVSGLGRTGARLAATLADAGVGTLWLSDSVPVSRRDLGADYGAEDIGRKRQTALGDRLRNRHTGTQIRTSPLTEIDAAVLVNLSTPDLTQAAPLFREEIAHLSLVVGEVSGTCGPWVVPGATACLRCQSLAYTDFDPDWPALGTQLSADSPLEQRGEDPCLAGALGALGAAQVVAALTGWEPTCSSARLTLRLPDLRTEFTPVEEHEICGCQGPFELVGPVE